MANFKKMIGTAALGGAIGAANTQLGILQEEAKAARAERLMQLQEQSQMRIAEFGEELDQGSKVVGYGEDGMEITRKMLKENPENAKGMLSVAAYEQQKEQEIYDRNRLDTIEDRNLKIQAEKDIARIKAGSGEAGLPKGFDEVYKAELKAQYESNPEIKPSQASANARKATYDAFGLTGKERVTPDGGGGDDQPVAKPTEKELKELGSLIIQSKDSPEAFAKMEDIMASLAEIYGEAEAKRIGNLALKSLNPSLLERISTPPSQSTRKDYQTQVITKEPNTTLMDNLSGFWNKISTPPKTTDRKDYN